MDEYGPSYGSMYLNHPLLAVAIGPWLAALVPWTAYGVFVVGSLGVLYLSGRLLASVFDSPAQRGFAYCVMFCSLPTYLMLWAGQVHVLLVLAVTLILAGLMRLEQECRRERRTSFGSNSDS